jgi:DNA-directed RNA polymerase subunit H (RpoH/RPB5)
MKRKSKMVCSKKENKSTGAVVKMKRKSKMVCSKKENKSTGAVVKMKRKSKMVCSKNETAWFYNTSGFTTPHLPI